MTPTRAPRAIKKTDSTRGPQADPIGAMEDEGGGVVTPAQVDAEVAETMHSTTQPNQGKLVPRTEPESGCGCASD